METKVCSACKQEKLTQEFFYRNKKKGTLCQQCKACHSNLVKKHYQQIKDDINKIKQNLSCQKCGYNKIPDVLDFHHCDPSQKDNTIARMTSNKYQMEDVMKEIEKCVCLCSNCHREFHYLEKHEGITIEQFLDGG